MRKLIASITAAALFAGGLAAPAAAQQRRDVERSDQASARQQMQAGRTMSSREIEGRVVPQNRDKGRYLGFEFDPGASAYRLKFLSEEGQVTWIDVDARTGRVMRISK
jgi:uncharacterized membrane protein YkoI